MSKYADRQMDLADAALVRAAEREGIQKIFTVDRKDFSVFTDKYSPMSSREQSLE
jgi:predicted nucleic acid-binding protein